MLDSEILADVYLRMTGGQTGLFEDRLGQSKMKENNNEVRKLDASRARLPVPEATADELQAHQAWIEELDSKTDQESIWTRLRLD